MRVNAEASSTNVTASVPQNARLNGIKLYAHNGLCVEYVKAEVRVRLKDVLMGIPKSDLSGKRTDLTWGVFKANAFFFDIHLPL